MYAENVIPGATWSLKISSLRAPPWAFRPLRDERATWTTNQTARAPMMTRTQVIAFPSRKEDHSNPAIILPRESKGRISV